METPTGAVHAPIRISLSQPHAVQSDADRYRWIRDRPGMLGPAFCDLTGEEVDRLIDTLRRRASERS